MPTLPTFLDHALSLARQGFHVFPLVPDSKLPLIDDFPNLATRDESRIRDWWTDPLLGLVQPYNIGISTSRYGDNETLVVVDIDNKGKKKGNDEVFRLELEGKEFPETFTQRTPSGGRHLVYRHSESVKQGANVLGDGLDIRARGGYIVGAGSSIQGKLYSASGGDIGFAPDWIVSHCGRSPERKPTEAPDTSRVDRARAEARAIHYLVHESPTALEGAGGDAVTFQVAARVKDFGVDAEVCFDLMATHWNPKCQPPWSAEELYAKVENAYRYGQAPQGAAAPEVEFAPTEDLNEKNYLQKINQEYALIYVEGQHFILHETIDERGRPKRVFLSEASFKRRFSPYTVQVSKGYAPTYAERWLDWRGRREFSGVCFSPEREPKHGYYNLWRGFSVEPLSYKESSPDARRGFDLFMAHARDNICRGDKDLFKWLIGYFAHMIQKPYERPLTTLVFQGRKGTGKNALIDRVGKLLGAGHYLVAHDGRYLTSNFNGHLDSCLCLVLDEAFWSGDKAAEGKLKGLTTAPEICIERKGKEPYMVDNLVRIIVIGNEDWLVPASADERRYAVFRLGEGKMQNRDFFHTMRELMDNQGGSRILLHELKHFDLSTVDVNGAPATDALLDQKIETMQPFEQWLFASLSEGHLIMGDFSQGWAEEVDKNRVRQAFRQYAKERQITARIPDDRLIGRLLKRYIPALITNQKRRDGDDYVNVYRFPSLQACRAAWETHVGHKVIWE
jgi:hypothetical protein